MLTSQPTIDAMIGPALRRITEFADLPPNWDSYGAVPVSARALASARTLIEEVAAAGSMRDNARTAPWTSAPIADAGIQVEWLGDRARIEVQVAPDGTIGFVIERGEGDDAEYEERDEIARDAAVSTVVSMASARLPF